MSFPGKIYSDNCTDRISILNEAMRGFSKHFRQLRLLCHINIMLGFSGGSDRKESVCNAGDPGSIPGSGRSPGVRNGNPLHILAWRIPRTEKPGGLQSTGVQRVRHY